MSTIPEPVTPGTARMREVELREELVGINNELAALGLDLAVSILDKQKVLPVNCVGHDEFDARVGVYKTRIDTLTKEEAKHCAEFQKSTKALKRVREMSPDTFLLQGGAGHARQLQRELSGNQQGSKSRYTNTRRELMQAKIALNQYYETNTSMDEEDYHRVLGEILDRKLQVHKALLALARRP